MANIKYKPEFADQVYKLCLLGATDAQLAEFFGVDRGAIYRWVKKEPAFAEALRTGKLEADAEIAKSLFHRAKGYAHPDVHITNNRGKVIVTEITKHYPPDTTACIFWLKNRRRDDWRDVQDVVGKVKHDHTHRAEGLSDTAQWLEETLGRGAPPEDPVPVSH